MGIKISAMVAASTLSFSDVTVVLQSGANKKTDLTLFDEMIRRIGTKTTSDPFTFTQTWNAVGTTFTAVKMNVVDTASAAASLLMDLQLGSVSKFVVGKDGKVGIGTTAPGRLLSLRATTPEVNLETIAGKVYHFGVSGNDFSFTETGVAQRLFIKAGVGVGIDNTNPQAALDVTGSVRGTTAPSIAGYLAANQLGYMGSPVNALSDAAYTIVAADSGKLLVGIPSVSRDITVPANATVAFGLGTVIGVLNTGPSSLVIKTTNITLNRGDGTVGSGADRTVPPSGLVSLIKTGTDTWWITGSFA